MPGVYQILRMSVRCSTDMKVFVSLVCCVLVTSAEPNNVCSGVYDYDTITTNKNCWFNPDVILPVPEIITNHGYPLEVYEVTTQDGYILQLFRIPHGRPNGNNSSKKSLQPVLLIPGVLSSTAPYTVNGNKSIGFILADEGYDVWLMNSRGSTYGKGHLKLSVNDTRYWNFSYHEMAVYDLPKNLDLIYKLTKRKDIIVIGQSMGTNIQLVYASELPEHAKKRVKFMVYLAPTVFLQYIRSPLAKLQSLWPTLYKYTRKIGVGEVLSLEQLPLPLKTKLCAESGVQVLTCELLIFTLFGVDFANLLPETFPILLGHYPAGGSMKTLDHLYQSIQNGKFAKYDYGLQLNLKYYRLFSSPDYKLHRVNIPGYISYAVNDFLGTKEGSIRLYQKLPKNNIIYEIKDKKYNHADFFFAKNVVEEVINPMLSVINNYKVTLEK